MIGLTIQHRSRGQKKETDNLKGYAQQPAAERGRLGDPRQMHAASEIPVWYSINEASSLFFEVHSTLQCTVSAFQKGLRHFYQNGFACPSENPSHTGRRFVTVCLIICPSLPCTTQTRIQVRDLFKSDRMCDRHSYTDSQTESVRPHVSTLLVESRNFLKCRMSLARRLKLVTEALISPSLPKLRAY